MQLHDEGFILRRYVREMRLKLRRISTIYALFCIYFVEMIVYSQKRK